MRPPRALVCKEVLPSGCKSRRVPGHEHMFKRDGCVVGHRGDHVGDGPGAAVRKSHPTSARAGFQKWRVSGPQNSFPPTTSTNRQGVFTLDNGKNMIVTFFLVAILFMLWAILNSLIDTMDKHFQDLLHLTKANSAWVQTAHYFGYTLMALPAGLITRKIGYKGGIIFGLFLVSLGGFWFVPATTISQFWAFLMGVCLV